MAALLVREAPAEVRDWLKATAAENRRSFNQQIIDAAKKAGRK